MNLTEAQKMADDCMLGNGYLYTDKEKQAARDALWSASRVDYNRLEALDL